MFLLPFARCESLGPVVAVRNKVDWWEWTLHAATNQSIVSLHCRSDISVREAIDWMLVDGSRRHLAINFLNGLLEHNLCKVTHLYVISAKFGCKLIVFILEMVVVLWSRFLVHLGSVMIQLFSFLKIFASLGLVHVIVF